MGLWLKLRKICYLMKSTLISAYLWLLTDAKWTYLPIRFRWKEPFTLEPLTHSLNKYCKQGEWSVLPTQWCLFGVRIWTADLPVFETTRSPTWGKIKTYDQQHHNQTTNHQSVVVNQAHSEGKQIRGTMKLHEALDLPLTILRIPSNDWAVEDFRKQLTVHSRNIVCDFVERDEVYATHKNWQSKTELTL